MKLIIGSDHRGFHIKLVLQERLRKYRGTEITWLDVGCFDAERCDYPPFAEKVARAVLAKEADAGILLCGSGVGVSIVANRFPGIYAAIVWTAELARLAKEHDNANILIFPADVISADQAVQLVQEWLGATFKEGRYQQRLLMVDSLEVCPK